MGYLNFNSEVINNFRVTKIKKSSGEECLQLEVETENQHLKYKIFTDENHKDLNKIESDIQSALQQTNNGKNFGINEYLERAYIFVTFPNGEMKKYSALKI